MTSLMGWPSSARRTLARATRFALRRLRRLSHRLRPHLRRAWAGLRRQANVAVGCEAAALFGVAVGFPFLTGPLALVLALIAVVLRLRE